MRRDRWSDFLARILPWFDERAWKHERAMTARVLERADRVLAEVARVEAHLRGCR